MPRYILAVFVALFCFPAQSQTQLQDTPVWVQEALELAAKINEQNLFSSDDAALDHYQRVKLLESEERLQGIRNLTFVALSSEQDDAEFFLSEYKNELEALNNEEHRGFYDIFQIFHASHAQGKYAELTKSLISYKNQNNLSIEQLVILDTFSVIGNMRSGQQDNAISLVTEIERLLKANDVDPLLAGSFKGAKALVFYHIGDDLGAVRAMAEEVELSSQSRDIPVYGQGNIYNLTAFLYNRKYFLEARKIITYYEVYAQTSGSAWDMFFANNMYGRLLLQENDYPLAIQYLKKSKTYIEVAPQREVLLNLDLAKAYFGNGQIETARFYLDLATSTEDFQKLDLAKANAKIIETQILAEEGELETAYNKLLGHYQNSESDYDTRLQGISDELRGLTQLRAGELRERETLLDEREKLQDMARSRRSLILLLGGILVLALLGFGIWQRAVLQNLKVVKNQAMEASRSKSEFLANMSHEIRTPMNGVLGMAELLLESDLSSRQKTFAETIVNSGSSLMTILNDILDFSKIEAGKIELDPVPFSMSKLAEQVSSLFAHIAAEKGIELILRVHTHIPAMVIGDNSRIRQILTNLVGNAIKFTHEGQVIIDIDGEIIGDSFRARVSILDTGIGIHEDKIGSIFKQFTQSDGKTTRRFGGTGLGLTISKSLIEEMGGEITASSQYGQGSEFIVTVTLPVSEAQPRKAPEVRIPASTRILIVDDLDINRKILSEQLQTVGIKPDDIDNGNGAHSILKSAVEDGHPYELAIIDYQMPEMDGEALIQKLREEESLSGLKIIVLSSVDNDRIRKSFREMGVGAYLTKPAPYGTLIHSVTEVLNVVNEQDVNTEHSDERNVLNNTEELELSEPGRIKILIAEDNPVNRLVILNMIDESRFKITFAENGQEALKYFQNNQFALVFMDISMPIMDGEEATKAIRAFETVNDRYPTPIIALTAHVMDIQKQKFLELGMDDHLAKPISKMSVTTALEKWVPQVLQSEDDVAVS